MGSLIRRECFAVEVAAWSDGSGTTTYVPRGRSWLGLLLAVALAGCGAPERFVFIHGAWMGGWVWEGVAAALTQWGAQVSVVDLPAHGDDDAPMESATMDAYVARVAQVVNAGPVPVHLVGHSLGGMAISRYAELEPEKLESLIYVAALIPANGQSAVQLIGQDPGSQLGPSLIFNADGTVSLPEEQLGPLMCADCNQAQLAPLLAGHQDEPLLPGVTPLHLTQGRFGSVSKRAVFAVNDVVISYGYQQQMASTVTLDCTRTLRTSHTPLLSKPQELAAALGLLSQCY